MASLTKQISKNKCKLLNFTFLIRRYAEEKQPKRKGLVLGLYNGHGDTNEFKLTPTGMKFNSLVGGRLEELLRQHGGDIPKGQVQVFQNFESEFYSVAVAGLGREDVGYNPLECLDECKENVRVAAGAGTRALRSLGVPEISVEGMGQTEAAAEGAFLANWRIQDLRTENKRIEPNLEVFMDDDTDGWQRGQFKAESQNLARTLSDTPSNYMTPTAFAHATLEACCACGLQVKVRDKEWIERKKFNVFLTVARGSVEPPVVLELSHCGGPQDEKPILIVAKGVTYDSGGICLRKCKDLPEYRADCSGAAAVVATMRALAILSLPINVQAVIPLCENMPSGMAMRPGDIVHAMNGKSIQIDDTGNEGRIIMADAICYGRQMHDPRMYIDVASLTRGSRAALGSAASAVFTNNYELWKEMCKAGSITGDRVWRFPLWNHFTKKVTHIPAADVTNVGLGEGGSLCKGAAFIQEFIPCGDWVHIDCLGAAMLKKAKDYTYLQTGRMTGRPTRTLIQFLTQLACPACPPAKQ